MNVGVKELKNSLSRYLRAVSAGETVLVTERGKVVAELRPRAAAPASAGEEVLDKLARDGVLSRGRGKVQAAAPIRLKSRAKASAVVIADRND